MKIAAEIDKDDVKYFNDSIDKLFNDINYYVSSPASYDTGVAKVQRGIKENKLAMNNSAGWREVKEKLVRDGKIPYKEPLNVTGQLAQDFYAMVSSTSPKDLELIGVELSFKDQFRLRPTMQSMYAASKDPTQPIQYEMKSSLEIATKLEMYTGSINGVKYNITDAIYGLYNQDFEKLVYAAVAKAFNANT